MKTIKNVKDIYPTMEGLLLLKAMSRAIRPFSGTQDEYDEAMEKELQEIIKEFEKDAIGMAMRELRNMLQKELDEKRKKEDVQKN